MAEIPPFAGFGPDALAFLAGLAEDNSKAYFDQHRRIYEEQVAPPTKSLVVDVGARLADRVAPGIRAEPKVGRSLFRINRDLRFSADTTPYHPDVDDAPGGALAEAIAAVRRRLPGATLPEATRAKVPKGYPDDHPRADLLRRDAMHLSVTTAPPASLTSARFVPWLVGRYERLAPFERWLVDHVG